MRVPASVQTDAAFFTLRGQEAGPGRIPVLALHYARRHFLISKEYYERIPAG